MKPESKPLYKLDDILSWTKPPEGGEPVIPYHSEAIPNRVRTLVCHDMAGGYLDDKHVQGTDTYEAYTFFNWKYVDIFVYFSHHFVTIPPPCWINNAHKHNVLVLGTLITEWDDGKDKCNRFLESETIYENLANKLVDVADYYGFDGWLVNIENKIETSEQVGRLCHFTRYLTERMHERKKYSQVLWYDSVIITGELKWQNQLNSSNKIFFDACDGIFLNYTWIEEGLQNSLQVAGDRNFDVYVGADVFGRNCPGGGGYNTKEAVSKARQYDLSVAIFAQGWVYETQNKKNFLKNEQKFWSLLDEFCPPSGPCHFPISSNFSIGRGISYWEGGVKTHGEGWYNLTTQSLQPFISPDFHFEDAFQGGVCIRLKDTGDSYFKLFTPSVRLNSEPLFICFTYKLVQGSHNIVLKLKTDQSVYAIGDKNSGIEALDESQLHDLIVTNENNKFLSHSQDWTSKCFVLHDLPPLPLREVGLSCLSSEGSKAEMEILLGRICIVPLEQMKKSLNSSIDLVVPSNSQLPIKLEWVPSQQMEYYTVYKINNKGVISLLGHTHYCYFYITTSDNSEDKEIITDCKFKVVGVPFCGISIDSNVISL